MEYSNLENNERYQILRPYLDIKEQLLWSGTPCNTRKYKPNIFILIFLIFWNAFAILWVIGATAGGGAFGLFGLPFIAIGVFLLYQFVFVPGKKLSRTVYAVTDTRVIILVPSKNGYDMNSYLFRTMQEINFANVKDDSGTIVFPHGFASFEEYRLTMQGMYSALPTDRFLLIDGVNGVYRLIMEQIEAGK